MRAYEAKGIIERLRTRGTGCRKAKSEKRRPARSAEEGLPVRESMQARWRGHAHSFSENSGPLRRYLDSQVGRPWNKVYSEIRARAHRHPGVRDRIESQVNIHVVVIDGVLCSGEGSRDFGTPLAEHRWRRWYVCPHSGLLRRIRFAARNRKRSRARKTPPKRVRVSDTLQCRFQADAWHLVTLEPLPATPAQRERSRARDVLLNRPVAGITPGEARAQYGAEVYAVASRRLARRELQQFPIPMEWWE